MALSIGIIGLPNVGKSTLFNAMTAANVPASNYPFCTVDPNIGVVEVPDRRLRQLEAILHPHSCTPTSIHFVDIAGLVRGASKGEGLGNAFLGHVRETDALVHVVRCFTDPEVVHVDGRIDPLRDVGTIETELLLADLETVEKMLVRLDKVVRTDPRSSQRLAWEMLGKAQHALQSGTPIRALELALEERQALHIYRLLTQKPVLYIPNVEEREAATGGPAAGQLAAVLGVDSVLSLTVQIEAEIAQLPVAERQAFLADLGLEQTGIDRLILAAYKLLGLLTFYTMAHDKLQAWQLPRGTLAPAAAGRIHSDMEKGFIRAEVAAFDDLAACGNMGHLREMGKLRIEGRDYVVEDGDVVHFLFRP